MNKVDPFWLHWTYGGVCCAPIILLLGLPHYESWPVYWSALYLLLPAYMLHQFEEHYQDRFRLFFNQTIGQGFEILSPFTVWLTNIVGVWFVLTVAFLSAVYKLDQFSVVGPALLLVNAIVHIAHAIKFRSYNPGLWTAIFAFLPMGLWTLSALPEQTMFVYVCNFTAAVLLHALILVHAIRRLREFKKVKQGSHI